MYCNFITIDTYRYIDFMVSRCSRIKIFHIIVPIYIYIDVRYTLYAYHYINRYVIILTIHRIYNM